MESYSNLRQRRKTKPDQTFVADSHTISTEQQTDYGEAQGLDEDQPLLGLYRETALVFVLSEEHQTYYEESEGELDEEQISTEGELDEEQPPLGQISTDNVSIRKINIERRNTISTQQQTDYEQSEGALDEEQPPLGQISTENVSRRNINIERRNTISTQQQTDYEQSEGALDEEQSPLGQISIENVSRRKINIERILSAINFLIEIPALTFDQISSKHKPIYALMAMLMSFMATLLSIIELAYKARKEKVVWRWKKLPWFYHPSPRNKRFGTFPPIFGLVCAILQSILSAIIYGLYLHHADYPIKISFWPLIFSLGLFCSKFM